MKTCSRFASIRSGFEREVHFLRSHSERYEDTAPARASANIAASTKQRMAKALSRHFERCPECG
jgi:hypothetical protein